MEYNTYSEEGGKNFYSDPGLCFEVIPCSSGQGHRGAYAPEVFSIILVHFTLLYISGIFKSISLNAMRYLENAIHKLMNVIGVFLLLKAIMWAFLFFSS